MKVCFAALTEHLLVIDRWPARQIDADTRQQHVCHSDTLIVCNIASWGKKNRKKTTQCLMPYSDYYQKIINEVSSR